MSRIAASLMLAAVALVSPGCDFFGDNCGSHAETFYGVSVDRDASITWGEASAPVTMAIGTELPGCVVGTSFGSASYGAYIQVDCLADDKSAIDFQLEVDADAWETMTTATPVSASWAYNHAAYADACGALISGSSAVTVTRVSSTGSRLPEPDSATADYQRTWLLEVDTTKVDASQRLNCADSVDLVFSLTVTQDQKSFLFVKDASDCY